MKEYTTVYLDDNKNLGRIEESLKSLKDSRIVKVYDSPNISNIEEQVQLARSQGFDKLNILLSEVQDKDGFEKDLNESYGAHFKNGIHIISLDEADAVQVMSNNGDIQASGQVKDEPNMIIFNPFGVLLFDSSGNLSPNLIRYIEEAYKFIDTYGSNCKGIYIIDSRLDSSKVVDPNATLDLNFLWLDSIPRYERYKKFFNETWTSDSGLKVVHRYCKNGREASALFKPGSYIYLSSSLYTPTVSGSSIKALNTDRYRLVGSKVGTFAYEELKLGKLGGIPFDVVAPYEDTIPPLIDSLKEAILEKSKSQDLKDFDVRLGSLQHYLSVLIQWYDTNEIFRTSIGESKSGVALSNRRSLSALANSTDRMYKNRKLDRINKDNYWSFGFRDKYLNPDNDPVIAKAEKDIDKYLLNKEIDGNRFVDKTLEKAYNIKYLPSDITGIDSDDKDERFDYKRYNSEDKSIEGVSGIQVYKLEQKRKEIADKIDKINYKIEELDDTDEDDIKEIRKLNGKIKDLTDEDDDLVASIDSAKRSEDSKEKIQNVKGIENKSNKDDENSDGDVEKFVSNPEEISKKLEVYKNVLFDSGTGNELSKVVIL